MTPAGPSATRPGHRRGAPVADETALPAPASHDGPAAPTAAAIAALRPLRLRRGPARPGRDCSAAGRRATPRPPCPTASASSTARQAGQPAPRVRRRDRRASPACGSPTPTSTRPWRPRRGSSAPGRPRERLRTFWTSRRALLAKAQDDDGYLNSYFQADHRDRQWRELRFSHELYCAGHLIQAAVAAARAGRRRQLVTVGATRSPICSSSGSGPDGRPAVCGHPGDRDRAGRAVPGHRTRAVPRARRTLRRPPRARGCSGRTRSGRQYYQDHEPVREATEVTGHVVRQLYLLAGAVDVAVRDGRRGVARGRRTAVGVGVRQPRPTSPAGTAPGTATRPSATRTSCRRTGRTPRRCAAIASFQWNWRLLLATGEHRYADEMERVLLQRDRRGDRARRHGTSSTPTRCSCAPGTTGPMRTRRRGGCPGTPASAARRTWPG